MTDAELASALDFAKGLAHEAGVIMKRYFRADDIGIELKEDDSPVTVADNTVNALVIEKVKAHYPEFGVIGEEDSYETEREWLWVVDPVDGTSPFSLGLPLSTFCLALVHKGNVQLSVVYDLFLDRLFTAQLGMGALVNGEPLKVSAVNDFKNQYALGFRSLKKENHESINDMFDELQRRGTSFYSFPSFTYGGLLVAEGRFIAACMQYGSPWDAAAISLIVQEAGGTVTDLSGKPRKFNEWGDGLLVSNGLVHDEIVRLIDNENPRH